MPDFDALFAALTAWPYSFKYADIARMTPRQAIELWERLDRASPARAISGDPGDETAPAPRKKKGDFRDKYACWKPTDIETQMRKEGLDPDTDPFVVSREIIRDRTWAVFIEFCHKGMLQGQGVAKDDMAAARDLFDRTWRESDAAFEGLRACFTAAADAGKVAFLAMNRAAPTVSRWGKFKQEDEAAALAWYDTIRARHFGGQS